MSQTKASVEPDYFYQRSPYKEAFDIEYPQEPVPGMKDKYRCRHCKLLTTEIDGLLENHKPDCAYRLQKAAQRG